MKRFDDESSNGSGSRGCDDGDPCTRDSCDPCTGEVIHEPVDCTDGDSCTCDNCDTATDEVIDKHRVLNRTDKKSGLEKTGSKTGTRQKLVIH